MSAGLVTAVAACSSVMAASGTMDRAASVLPGSQPAAMNWLRPPEVPDDPPAPAGAVAVATSPAADVVLGPYVSVQVNVNAAGDNIVGDAANEPSIAVDPVHPARLAIGWRQFDTTTSNFRQAGWAYSHDSGKTWAFPGTLDPGLFRSDPVLASDADGNFYYYSLRVPQPGVYVCDLFKSTDGGVTWSDPVYGYGGDKGWMTVDRTSGPGRGHIYTHWNSQISCCSPNDFARSTDGGASFQPPLAVPLPSMKWGTMDVGPDGALHLAGMTLNADSFLSARSSNAENPLQQPSFDFVAGFSLGGAGRINVGPNPGGLAGQAWVATDDSAGPYRGNVYVVASVDPNVGASAIDPLDVMFARSIDGGRNWSAPVRINTDPLSTAAWQWFATMSVAPNGRIDVVWNDNRNTLQVNRSQLFYSYSLNAGVDWSENTPVSPVFNSFLGWPNQSKIGDYYHMVSDNFGASVAYAATFNEEQDVYFLRIGEMDCNRNGIADSVEISDELVEDCNDNQVPDDCETDCNGNGQEDSCDVTLGGATDCDANRVPDECQRDFDNDGVIDGCDPDSDGDGVDNADDLCAFTPPGTVVGSRGRPISDFNANCRIDLQDYSRLYSCFDFGGPGVLLGTACSSQLDYDFDLDVDMVDFAGFQNAFGP